MATSPGKVLELPELRIRPGARIAPLVESLYCPNLRTGASFAVADSYQEWNDVTEASVVALLSNVKITVPVAERAADRCRLV